MITPQPYIYGGKTGGFTEKKVLISPEAFKTGLRFKNTICKSYAGKNKNSPILKQTNLFQNNRKS
jgi:hypothetical protein